MTDRPGTTERPIEREGPAISAEGLTKVYDGPEGELRAVDDGSMTVVLSSHDMDVIEELCDRVIIMSDGRVIADDTVENLTGVFSLQAYEVTIDGRLPERTRQTVERNHTVESWESTPGGSDRFEVVLEDGHELYDLVGALEASGRPIAAIDAIQPDLESAFLDITNRGGTESTGTDTDRERPSSADATTPEPDGGSKRGESR
jgi:ABC-2 type transport system ATP-binding protein